MMILSAAAWLTIAWSASPARAASPRRAEDADDWNLALELPKYYRGEQRQLADADVTEARAEIETWMQENDALDSKRGAYNEKIWLVPLDQIRNMDSMLAQYGKLRRGRPFRPEDADDEYYAQASAVPPPHKAEVPRINENALARRKETLEAESESRNTPDTPNIDRLISSYIKSLETAIDAQRRYDKYATVFISIPPNQTDEDQNGPAAPRWDPDRDAPRVSLIDGWYLSSPGAVRYPTPSRRGLDDYLMWCADAPMLDEEYTLSVRVVSDDPTPTIERLRTEFERMGIKPAHIDPRMGPYYSITQNRPQATPVLSYWVSPETLGDFRMTLQSAGSITSWTSHIPAQFSPFAHSAKYAVKWEQALSDELESEPDHLAAYPATRSLVVDQIRKLSTFPPLANPESKMELVALDIVGAPGRRPLK
ncbi:MAG: hypothetical protein KGJ84_05780 [Elusimicrobia bacterium]|nr:hypothetical protein [Elusimicrobiota bacterium]